MKSLLVVTSLFFVFQSYAQDVPEFKFGEISKTDFANKTYVIDPDAEAVVLADIGSTVVKGNSNGWFSLEFKLFRRIHILKSSGFNQATVGISLYTEGKREEKLDNLRAVSYNLENNKVVETKLNTKSGVFEERIDKNSVIKRFTLPGVKEGTIIEFEYKLKSDFLFNIQPWRFQVSIPQLWSQYNVALPQFLNYVILQQKSIPYYVSDQKTKQENYSVDVEKEVYLGKRVTEQYDVTSMVTDFRWVMKDVPAFKEEAFTSSSKNYIPRLEFQLAGYREPLVEEDIMQTWQVMTARLLERDDFGKQLDQVNNPWIESIVTPLIKNEVTDYARAANIYNYIRDNYTCTNYYQLYTEESLRKIADRKSGGVAELNLLLITALRTAGLRADPVLLSTKEHGIVNDQYPFIQRFNYVICRVKLDGKDIYLDASHPGLGFGKLPLECYNGSARLVNADATLIKLNPDMLQENRQTTVFIYKEPKGNWTGYVSRLYGYYDSWEIRKKINKNGNEVLQKDLSTQYADGIRVDSVRVDSLKLMNEPMRIHYVLKSGNEGADLIYMTPVLTGYFKENPFKSAVRSYPVEMPYKVNELYTLRMEIPDGYAVEEIPKSLTIKLNDSNDAVFKYSITQSATEISLTCSLEINRTFFSPAEYNLLRQFFGNIVSKLNEQVVFKKKS